MFNKDSETFQRKSGVRKKNIAEISKPVHLSAKKQFLLTNDFIRIKSELFIEHRLSARLGCKYFIRINSYKSQNYMMRHALHSFPFCNRAN